MAVLSVENLSKSFLISQNKYEHHTTFRDKLGYGLSNILRNPASDQKEIFHALQDVSFEINQGEKIGLIGNNGAGKSTLLKILSRIISPSSGRITIHGKISSLIEVGTGFHLELNGAENILLSGTILGMSKNEIRSRFDEIVAFAELENYIYTPVKRYSSGMQIRLAFSVAAHLIADILILDEVLAVGDQSFQNKCLAKITEITQSGKTLIFVSHDFDNLTRVCTKGLLLHKGKLVASGAMDDVWTSYQSFI